MSVRIVVVGEGPTDPPLVCDLADRVLREQVVRQDVDQLEQCRVYIGLENDVDGVGYVAWKDVKRLFLAARLRSGNRFGGKSRSPDYVTTRKLLRLIANYHRDQRADGGVAGVLIFRDADNEPERRQGIDDACAAFKSDSKATHDSWCNHIAVGFAEPMNEAWVLAGFEPQDDDERAELAEARKGLGFQPNQRPERLRPGASEKSPKKVLARLCPDNERRAQCWQQTDLDVLRERGANCGLRAYLDAVETAIVPLFAHPGRP